MALIFQAWATERMMGIHYQKEKNYWDGECEREEDIGSGENN